MNMNITFVSADDAIRMTFGIDPWSAVTDLTKIEKELGKDLTDIIQKAIDVVFNVTSQTFTRGPKDAYIVSYSREMQPIIGGHITKDNAVESISVTVSDSDHNLYEFEDIEDRNVDAMITWLRKEHHVYYSPNDELLNEKKKWAEKVAKQQKKIDSYEATLSKITDIMEPKYAGPTWSETWDDLVERIKRMKEKIEELEEKLKHAAQVEVWYRRTNRELVMERDKYRDTCEELKQDVYEWEDRFDKICDELDTSERDFDEVFDELRKNLNELDKLAEFKAKLAEVIKLPEDMKGTATAEDYISSFEHTKNEWRKMEIKLENYEREIRFLNEWLEEKKKELGASNGAMDVLRSLHGSIVGLCDIDDCPQIIGARIIDKFNRVKAEKEELKTDYANAKCARAELANLYRRTFDVDRLDPELSPHEIAVQIRKRMRELEQKLNSIREIYDGDGV